MGITEKQRWRLTKEGYNPDVLDEMSFEQASDKIGKLPKYQKEVKQRQIERIHQVAEDKSGTKYWKDITPKPKQDTSSYYVSYAKDIVVALLDIARPDESITDVKLIEIMGSAVAAVKLAKSEFER